MDLALLTNRTIAIEVEINGRQVTLRGVAAFETLSNVGPALRIHVLDPAGEFDVILQQGRWNGPILADRTSGCDYRIALQASELCVQ
jgi:hypothetical protein